jgi:hypothetical protein
MNLYQAAPLHPASSPPKFLRHRLGSKPPTGAEDDDFLPADASFYHILGSSVMFPLNGIFNHYKPTLDEALPHHCIMRL